MEWQGIIGRFYSIDKGKIMCHYCLEKDSLSLSGDFIDVEDKRCDAWIDSGKNKNPCIVVEYEEHKNDIIGTGEFTINIIYCPMCGEKLI